MFKYKLEIHLRFTGNLFQYETHANLKEDVSILDLDRTIILFSWEHFLTNGRML